MDTSGRNVERSQLKGFRLLDTMLFQKGHLVFYVIWTENDSNPLLESVDGEKSGISCSACCLFDLTTDKETMGRRQLFDWLKQQSHFIIKYRKKRLFVSFWFVSVFLEMLNVSSNSKVCFD